MGKLIVTVQMSADASIGPDIGWFQGEHEEEASSNELRLADAMVLGRKTYEALAPIWLASPGPFAERVNEMPKYVASTTPAGPLRWNATAITVDDVDRLKKEHDGNLLTYGCGEFAFDLVRLGLVDEIHFWVHPVVWQETRRPFHGLGHIRMNHMDTQ